MRASQKQEEVRLALTLWPVVSNITFFCAKASVLGRWVHAILLKGRSASSMPYT